MALGVRCAVLSIEMIIDFFKKKKKKDADGDGGWVLAMRETEWRNCFVRV